jgi:prepilin-type N-terminal cleavage/methylation domain-containing protein
MRKTESNLVRRVRPQQGCDRGFTIIELMIVLVILGIAAAIAVPMVSSAASMQLRSAVNMVAADLEYAKSMSISTGQYYSVEFNTAQNRYEVQDPSGAVIPHPVSKKNYAVSFGDDGRLDQVTIQGVTSGAAALSEVCFDYLGTPRSSTAAELTNPVVVTLQAGGATRTVTVKAVTGFISVD